VNSVVLSRWLGPTGRGEIAAAMLWPTMLVYLSSMGLIMATMYFAALPESRPNSLFANATLFGIAQGTLAAIIGFAILPWVLKSQTPEVVGAGRLFLLVIPISLLTQYGVSILQGRLHISSFNWLRMILPTGYLAGTVILAIAGRLSLLGIILLHLFLNSVALIGTLIALSRAGVRLNLKPDADLAKEMLKYGGKVHVGNISGSLNLSLDQVLMAAWLPPAALGLYVAAVSSAGLSQVFSQAVQMVSTPSITQRETLSERASVLQGIFRSYWLLSFLITVAIGALLPMAIPLVFGSSFKGAIWPAEVLLAGAFFLGAQVVLAGGAQALGNPWLGSKANIGALIVTLVLLYLLLPRLGIMGAAIATAAAYLTQLIIVVSGLRSTHGIPVTGLFRIRLTDVSSAMNIFELIRGSRKRLVTDQS